MEIDGWTDWQKHGWMDDQTDRLTDRVSFRWRCNVLKDSYEWVVNSLCIAFEKKKMVTFYLFWFRQYFCRQGFSSSHRPPLVGKPSFFAYICVRHEYIYLWNLTQFPTALFSKSFTSTFMFDYHRISWNTITKIQLQWLRAMTRRQLNAWKRDFFIANALSW